MSKHTDITAFEANICPEFEYSNDFYTIRKSVNLSEDFPDTPALHFCDFIYMVCQEMRRNSYVNADATLIVEFKDFSSKAVLSITKRLGETLKARWLVPPEEYERIFR